MMKTKFWNHRLELFLGGTIATLLSISIFIVGIILTIINKIYFPLIIIGILMIIIIIYSYFIDKRMLSNVIFSDNGIECRWLKKKVDFVKWEEITDVKAVPHGIAIHNLSFIVGNKHINVGLSKKMYNTIMLICPETNLKLQIKNLKEFKHLHKND